MLLHHLWNFVNLECLHAALFYLRGGCFGWFNAAAGCLDWTDLLRKLTINNWVGMQMQRQLNKAPKCCVQFIASWFKASLKCCFCTRIFELLKHSMLSEIAVPKCVLSRRHIEFKMRWNVVYKCYFCTASLLNVCMLCINQKPISFIHLRYFLQ